MGLAVTGDPITSWVFDNDDSGPVRANMIITVYSHSVIFLDRPRGINSAHCNRSFDSTILLLIVQLHVLSNGDKCPYCARKCIRSIAARDVLRFLETLSPMQKQVLLATLFIEFGAYKVQQK